MPPEQTLVEVTAVRGFRFEGAGVKRGDTVKVPAPMAVALVQAAKAVLGKEKIEAPDTPSAAPTDLGLGHPPAAAVPKPAKK